MSGNTNRELARAWYQALQDQDVPAFQRLHQPDCIYNISGHTPISGQVSMPELMQHVLPLVFGALKLDEFRFCTRLSIVCADARRVVGMMEADGSGTNGRRYDQRYVHIFEFRDGLISQVWEFFDTALAADVMFCDPQAPVAGVDHEAFSLPG